MLRRLKMVKKLHIKVPKAGWFLDENKAKYTSRESVFPAPAPVFCLTENFPADPERDSVDKMEYVIKERGR